MKSLMMNQSTVEQAFRLLDATFCHQRQCECECECQRECESNGIPTLPGCAGGVDSDMERRTRGCTGGPPMLRSWVA